MKSIRKYTALLIAFVMTVTLVIMPVSSVYADNEDGGEAVHQAMPESLSAESATASNDDLDDYGDEEEEPNPALTVGDQKIIEVEYDEDYNETYLYYLDRLPAGVSFDKDTNTLTLDNVTINSSAGDSYGWDKAYIYSNLEKLNVILKGRNTFVGGGANYGIMGADLDSELFITGATADAGLTIDISDAEGRKTGLYAAHKMLIKDCAIDILGGYTPSGFFYGISMYPWVNYGGDGEYADGDFRLTIDNADIHISNKMPKYYDAYNAGIDSQDTNMEIINSNIDIDLTGSLCLGIGCGLYDVWYDYDDGYDEEDPDYDWGDEDDEDYEPVGPVYGGQLSIDDQSSVVIRFTDPNPDLLEAEYVCPLYYYNNDQEFADKIKSPHIYSCDYLNQKFGEDKALLRRHTWVEERYECVGTYLEFSPYDISLSKTAYTYNGTEFKPTATVRDASGNILSSTTTYKNNKNAGVGIAAIKADGKIFNRHFKIAKIANKLSVKGKTATVKASAVKKKAQYLTTTKTLRFVNKGQGTKTYSKVSGNAKITVNKTTGKITVKKGLKKGTYKVKVRVTAAGTVNYKSKSQIATVTIRVK